MKTIKNLFMAAAMALVSTSANAVIITYDFISMTSSLGEGGYSTLSAGIMDVTGTKSGSAAHAYLDDPSWSPHYSMVLPGGLGVCGTLDGPADGTGQCAPASDDNVTVDESLHFIFGQDVTILSIVFNNNHDADGLTSGDSIDVDGASADYDTYSCFDSRTGLDSNICYDVATDVAEGDVFDISYDNQQFYVSSITFYTVPEPAMIGLLGAGLVGIFVARRKARV